MNNNLFERFLPKENKFFLLLSEMADVIQQASLLLIDYVQLKDHQQIVENYKKIKEQERRCDKLQGRIFDELNNTFVTPFDREDIDHLSSRMDDVADYINSCAKRVMLYNPKEMPVSSVTLANLVNNAADCIKNAVGELDMLKKNPVPIAEYCQQLHDIENKADDVYEHFLINLFENEKDAIEVIKLKDILHELERATDAAETVGKIIKTIIVKYS